MNTAPSEISNLKSAIAGSRRLARPPEPKARNNSAQGSAVGSTAEKTPNREKPEDTLNYGNVRIGDALRLINGRAFKPSEWTKSGLPIVRKQNHNKPKTPNKKNKKKKQCTTMVNFNNTVLKMSYFR